MRSIIMMKLFGSHHKKNPSNTAINNNNKDAHKSDNKTMRLHLNDKDQIIPTEIELNRFNNQVFSTQVISSTENSYNYCQICNDIASGIHYGVETCNACKNFFKRTIFRKEKYVCYLGNDCTIMSENRITCRSCRFKKCLQVGMSLKASKVGRKPNVLKEKKALNKSYESLEKVSLPVSQDSTSKDTFESINTENEKLMINDKNLSKLTNKKQICFSNEAKSSENQEKNELIYLNEMFETFTGSDIKVKRFHSNWYASNPKLDMTFRLTITIMSDKAYQAHNETNNRLTQNYHRAQQLIKGKKVIETSDHNQNNADPNEVWKGILENIQINIINMIEFLKLTPGIGDKLKIEEMSNFIHDNISLYFVLKYYPLMIGDQFLLILENDVHCSKMWMTKLLGESYTIAVLDMAKKIKKLDLTTKETALLILYMLTLQNTNFGFSQLNKYYYKALMYEFDLNMRSFEFLAEWKKIIDDTPKLRGLYYNTGITENFSF